MRGYDFVGGITGLLSIEGKNPFSPPTLVNNRVSGLIMGNRIVGALAGAVYNEPSVVSKNTTDAIVSGNENVGGLIGLVAASNVSENSAHGTVSGKWCIGGLIGFATLGTPVNNKIENNFTTCTVSGDEYVGGLVGYILVYIIEKNYSVGAVTGNLYVGGIIGVFCSFEFNFNGMTHYVPSFLNNSLFDVQTTELNDIVGYQMVQTFIENSSGKTTKEMKIESTYSNIDWDFENVWEISSDNNNGYPTLKQVTTLSDKDYLIPINKFLLYANYPNPFNPLTTISFEIKIASDVVIDIYNVRGQLVKTLLNDRFPIGKHSVEWNGTDDNGKSVSSGVYFYQMRVGDFVQSRRMVMLK